MLSFYIYLTILFTGVVLGLVRWKRLAPSSRIILLFLVYIFLKEISAYLIAISTSFNLSYYKYLSLADSVFTLLILFVLPIMRKARWVMIIGISVLALFYIINLLYLQPPGFGIDSNFKILRSVVIVSLALILTFKTVISPDETGIIRKSEFWIAASLILFYSFNVFYWGMFNYGLANNIDFTTSLRFIFELTNYIHYLFLIIAMILNLYQRTPSSA